MSFIYLMPSFTSDFPGWWSNILPRDKIRLGLDLQGGMHLILEVESLKAVESHLERIVEELKLDLRKKKIRYLELSLIESISSIASTPLLKKVSPVLHSIRT